MSNHDPELLRAIQAIHAGDEANSLESETLDFKREISKDRDGTIRLIVEAVICFANTSGGTVVVGVADRPGGPAAFLGCNLNPDIVQQRIFQLTEPPLSVEVRAEDHYGASLLIVRVPQSQDLHSDKKGQALHRIGKQCFPLNPQEQALLRERRARFDWSAAATDSRIEDVSPLALELARQDLSFHPNRYGELAEIRSDADLLTALGVLTGEGALLRAGQLLFCTSPQSDTPSIVYIYRQTPGGEPSAVHRLKPPLLVAFHQTMDFISARRTFVPVVLSGGQQINIADFPEVAVREALSNAVIHRDYYFQRAVTVEHSPDAFVVTSPGPLVGGVTPSNILTHDSVTRNPKLAGAVRKLGLAEEIGRGVDRMYREMIQAGRNVPTIESASDQVRVVLTGGEPKAPIARYIAQLPIAEQRDTDTMLTLRTLCDRPQVDAPNLAPVLQKTTAEAQTVLRRLSGGTVGMVEPVRSTLISTYPVYELRQEVAQQLAPAISYARSLRHLSPDERRDLEQRVIALTNRVGEINASSIRAELEIADGIASPLLDSLASRDILARRPRPRRSGEHSFVLGSRVPGMAAIRESAVEYLRRNGVMTTEDAERELPLWETAARVALTSLTGLGIVAGTNDREPRYVAGSRYPGIDYFAQKLAGVMRPGDRVTPEELQSLLAVDDSLAKVIAVSLTDRQILRSVVRERENHEEEEYVIGPKFPSLDSFDSELAELILRESMVDVAWLQAALRIDADSAQAILSHAANRDVVVAKGKRRKSGTPRQYVPGPMLVDGLKPETRQELEGTILDHIEMQGSIGEEEARQFLGVSPQVALKLLNSLVKAERLIRVTTEREGRARVEYSRVA